MSNNIGLFFGSFNPIHIGHLAIANYFVEFTDLEQIWFVVSPQNPFKEKKSLLSDQLRLEIVELAITDDPRFSASDVEFRMPTPSYTIDTLVYLKEKHPGKNFNLIIGGDNLLYFSKWKNCQDIENNFTRYVYPRPGTDKDDYKGLKNCNIVDAPQIEISSSFIRKSIKEGKKVNYFLPNKVYEFIDRLNLYNR